MQENGFLKDPKKVEETIEKTFRTVTGKNWPMNSSATHKAI
jgi:hypothetical protein